MLEYRRVVAVVSVLVCGAFLRHCLIVRLVGDLLIMDQGCNHDLWKCVLDNKCLALLIVVGSSAISVQTVCSFFSIRFISSVSLLFKLGIWTGAGMRCFVQCYLLLVIF